METGQAAGTEQPARKNSEQPAKKNRKGMGKAAKKNALRRPAAAVKQRPEAALAALAAVKNGAAAADDDTTVEKVNLWGLSGKVVSTFDAPITGHDVLVEILRLGLADDNMQDIHIFRSGATQELDYQEVVEKGDLTFVIEDRDDLGHDLFEESEHESMETVRSRRTHRPGSECESIENHPPERNDLSDGEVDAHIRDYAQRNPPKSRRTS